MQHRPLKQFCGLVATAAIALVLIGCNGKSGAAGAPGAPGAPGTNGINGTSAAVTLNAAQLTPSEWSQLTLNGTVSSVTMGGAPVVNFKVTDKKGVPVIGLAQKDAATGKYLNFGFALAKLVPADAVTGSPTRWVNYIVFGSTPAAGTIPKPGFASVENTGTLKDNLDGSYTYTFNLDVTKVKGYVDASVDDATHLKADLDDLTYKDTLTHRVIVIVGGNQPGTTTPVLTSANLSYDFIPATGKPVSATDTSRVIVDEAACNTCHTKLSMHGAHLPTLQATKLCVVCHTEQHKYGAKESLPATGNVLVPGAYGIFTARLQDRALPNFPNMVHKIHMGEELYYQGYNQFGVKYNETTYPQDQRNCVKCHTASNPATPQGDNWNTTPSRLACGACHDGIVWATGVNHLGGAQTSDLNCAGCHGAGGIKLNHIPVSPSNPAFATGGYTNGSYLAGDPNNLPPGAIKIAYDLKSVTLDATRHPVFTFKFKQTVNGVTSDVVFNTYAAGTVTEMMNNFVGSPSVYMAFAVPQDGITTPADVNATASAYIKKVWNGAGIGTGAGTMTGPDASGYYTLTMTGVAIPANATMLRGGIGYTYNKNSQPLTQTNVPKLGKTDFTYNPVTMLGGFSVPAPNMFMTVTGSTARRNIVDTAKCNDCHNVLGVFTASAYHAGERNNAESCHFCHNPNQSSSAWSANASTFLHGIHGGGKRTVPFNWHATTPTSTFANVTYPAILNNCEACHVPGSYDFSNSANAAAIPNMLFSTVGKGIYNNNPATNPTGYFSISPYVVADNVQNYGTGPSYSAATGVLTQDVAGTNLVSSPITAACASCHDSKIAIAHFKGNGGSFYDTRATALLKVEQCLICHGSGKTADIKAVHMTFK
ncbi:MAG TPA: OmcA/MtrC family decaheme c-type cytochrome [Geothrix sp.]